MSKDVDISVNLNYDGNRGTYIRIAIRGNKTMTDNEKELINMIRETDNPIQALMTAAVIVLGYLKQHESSVAQAPADLQGLA